MNTVIDGSSRSIAVLMLGLMLAGCGGPISEAPESVERGARTQPGTEMGLYTPEQHPLYDGRFVLSGSRVFHVGSRSDTSPWDHMGDAADNIGSVGGTIEIDVNEIDNTGSVRAELELPETPVGIGQVGGRHLEHDVGLLLSTYATHEGA